MARTAPAPNIPPIPGMCPGMCVLAGGGDGGGGGAGSGGGGKGKKGAGTGKDEKDPKGSGKNAPVPKKYPTCGTKSHPVDVITGRAFTNEVIDLELGGPLEFAFERTYSVSAKDRDVGL